MFWWLRYAVILYFSRRRSASRAAEINHQEVYYRQSIKSLPPTALDHCNLSQSMQPRPSLPHPDQQRHALQFYNASTAFNYPPLTQQQPENEYSYIADLQLQPPTPTSGVGHVMSAGGWRCDPHASVFNANITPVDGVNSSRPVAVIPGLARDDKFRLPQRSTLKVATDRYRPKSELSYEADDDVMTMTDCATIAIRGVAPPNCGTAMSNGDGTEYQWRPAAAATAAISCNGKRHGVDIVRLSILSLCDILCERSMTKPLKLFRSLIRLFLCFIFLFSITD